MSNRYLGYALGVIFVANFFSYLDRQLVSALEKPITAAREQGGLGLSSAQFGFLWTLFTLGYMCCSPLIGYLSDRSRRPAVFSVCIFVWSLATVASGYAEHWSILYVSRFLIGVGEAGCLIIGSSLIADYFQREVRGRALSIFYLGLPLGGTFAFIMAGLLLKHVGWRNLFYIAGAPGFVLAVLIWFLIDPPRGGAASAAPHGHGAPKASMKDYLSLFRIRSLLYIILAQAFAMVTLAPLIHFGVKFFEDERGMKEEHARIALGLIALVAGAAGNAVSGVLGDRLSRKTRSAYALLAGVSYLAGLPCLAAGFLFTSPWLFLPALTLGAFALFLCMPAVNTQIANVARPEQRAMAWVLAVFVLHLLGDTLSPPLFGKIDPHLGRLNTFLIFSLSLIPASLCCFLAARTAADDEARASAALPKPL